MINAVKPVKRLLWGTIAVIVMLLCSCSVAITGIIFAARIARSSQN